MPMAIAMKFGMKMEEKPEGLSAQDVNGRELEILSIIKVIILTGSGEMRQIAFIVCDLPEGKEPLLNIWGRIALGCAV